MLIKVESNYIKSDIVDCYTQGWVIPDEEAKNYVERFTGLRYIPKEVITEDFTDRYKNKVVLIIKENKDNTYTAEFIIDIDLLILEIRKYLNCLNNPYF